MRIMGPRLNVECIMGKESMLSGAHVDGLAQDCSNSFALAMELLQSCTKPSICDSKLCHYYFR